MWGPLLTTLLAFWAPPLAQARAQVPAEQVTGGVRWLDDLGLATLVARETGRPLLIVFR